LLQKPILFSAAQQFLLSLFELFPPVTSSRGKTGLQNRTGASDFCGVLAVAPMHCSLDEIATLEP
jgi:hypothetical protein